MAGYHKYVFDTNLRKLVGDFEAMYAAEESEGFDSWRGHDVRHLRLKLALAIVEQYNFENVLEIGCGKGTVAQFLKRKNNRVIGIDVAPTAIAKAKASFPDIEFRCLDASKLGTIGESFNLVTVQAVLAYIEPWRDLLATAASITEYALVAEYVPPNPVGMVKSVSELVEVFSQHFLIEHKLVLDDEVVILFGRSRVQL